MRSTKPLPPLHRHTRSKQGFSLVELIAVVAIFVLLIGIGVSSLSGGFASRNLSEAGAYFESFASRARQHAITQNRLTAIVILKTPSGTPDTTRPDTTSYQTFSIFELKPPATGNANTSSDWKQITPWKRFGNEVVVDFTLAPESQSSFLKSPSVSLVPLPTITFQGKTYAPNTNYAYQIYKPSGRLLSPPIPCTLRLVNGAIVNGALQYRPNPAEAANYFQLTFVEGNGEIKITRPTGMASAEEAPE